MKENRPMIIATLGPAGSNHAFVLDRYMAARALARAQGRLVDAFGPAFEALVAGRIQFVLQCAAHPSYAECVGRYMGRAFPVDTFIAESRPLAVLARADVARPRTIGLQPATRHYTRLVDWEVLIEEPSIVTVAEGLLQGRFDAGICAHEILDRYPDRLRLVELLGPALDVWVLFGARRRDGELVLPLDAPLSQLVVD